MQKVIPLVCLILAGCGSTQFASQPITLAKPDAELVKPCQPPVDTTASTASQVETDWKKDRAALVSCGNRHKQQTQWYEQRDAKVVQ